MNPRPDTERTRALSYYAAAAGIGATLGLVLGGLFADLVSWRAGFFINLPIGIALMLAAQRLIVETPKHSGQFDLAGALSSTLGMTSLVFGIVHSAEEGWHTHPLGQTLVVTEGSGLIQFWDCPIQRFERGDVVSIPPGQKHWHGATATESMTHIAIQEQLNGKSVDWLEKVSDAQYRSTPSAKGSAATPSVQPSWAQQLMGDFAPKWPM